jgi:hypothetical protein
MMKEINQKGCMITIKFDKEEEARLIAPALYALLTPEIVERPRLKFNPPPAERAKEK